MLHMLHLFTIASNILLTLFSSSFIVGTFSVSFDLMFNSSWLSLSVSISIFVTISF